MAADGHGVHALDGQHDGVAQLRQRRGPHDGGGEGGKGGVCGTQGNHVLQRTVDPVAEEVLEGALAAQGEKELEVGEEGGGGGFLDGEFVEHAGVRRRRRAYCRILWMECE